jgi:hypothetical protein
MTVTHTFIENKWADPPNEVEAIRSESKRGSQTTFCENKRKGGTLVSKEMSGIVHGINIFTIFSAELLIR